MSTNTERAPWETPAGRAEPVTGLNEQVGGRGAEDYMTVRRELAIKRIKAKNAFKVHLLVYLTVNTMLVVIWAALAAAGWSQYLIVWQDHPQDFFWPIFPIVGWGIGLVINGYVVYRGNVYTEEQIQREMQKLP
jgi:hypothetical protein